MTDDESKRMHGKLDDLTRLVYDIKGEIQLLKYKSSVWGILGGGIVIAGALIIRKLGA